MKRLLMVTTVASTLRAFLLPFAYYFRATGWTVDAVAFGVSSCSECRQAFNQVHEINWSRNPVDPHNLLAAGRRIQEIVARGDYDIVHVHTPVAGWVTRYALRNIRSRGKPKVVYTAHGFHFHSGGAPLRNLVFRTLEQIAGQWCDAVIVINREDEAAATKFLPPSTKLVYMPGIGVDMVAFAPDRVSAEAVAAVRAELNLVPEQPLFLMIAEFSPGKRHQDALRAFSLLRHSGAHLAFAGTGRMELAMKRLAKKLGIDHRVHFLGFRRDIPALIRASVATILPSEREGLPRSIMESLSLEVPVIGTDIRGIRDLLADHSGLLVPLGDVVALAFAMDWILDHPEQATEMGLRGRSRMRYFELNEVIARHEALYASLLEE